MLRLHLDHLDAVDAALALIDKEIDGNVEPFRVAIQMLTTISGISHLEAEVLVSGDRHRHEPIQDRGPFDLLGGALSKER